jgi:hypothetical protein
MPVATDPWLLDDLAAGRRRVQLGVGMQERDVGELEHSVDGQEHEELAVGEAQLIDVDVDLGDRGFGEALALRGQVLGPSPGLHN